MIKQFVTFSALLCLAAGAPEISHLSLNGAHLIYTGPSSYALAGSMIEKSNWKSVSLNGDNVVIFTSSACDPIIKSFQDLADEERTLLLEAKSSIEIVDNPGGYPQRKVGPAKHIYDGDVIHLNGLQPSRVTIFNSNGFTIHKSDEANYSAVGGQLASSQLARLFVIGGELIACVHDDGRVYMKPASCLLPTELPLIEQIKSSARESEPTKPTPPTMPTNSNATKEELEKRFDKLESMIADLTKGAGDTRKTMLDRFDDLDKKLKEYSDRKTCCSSRLARRWKKWWWGG